MVPLHAPETEKAVLGALFVDQLALDAVGELQPEHFYVSRYAELFRLVLRLRKEGLPVDTTSATDALRDRATALACGGVETLMDVTTGVFHAAHVERHAMEIRNLAQRRALTSACMQAGANGYDASLPFSEYLETTEASILSILASNQSDAGLVRIDPGTALREIERIVAEKKAGRRTTGLPTGLSKIDGLTTGMHPGELWVVAGRPGMGKSGLALRVAIQSVREKKPAAFFSLEMKRSELERRALSWMSGVPISAIRGADLTIDHWSMLSRAAGEIDPWELHIDDMPGATFQQIRSRCRRLAARTGPLGVVVIDYLQLMRGVGKQESREREVSEISRSLKELAKEMKCPVVALSQLNRSCESRPDKRPQLSDLRESGAIEQDADVVALCYRRGYYSAQMAANPEAKEEAPRYASKFPSKPKTTIEAGPDDGKAEVIIAKNRHGSPGVAHVTFSLETSFFHDEGETSGIDRGPRSRFDPYAHIGGSPPDDRDGDGSPWGDDDFDPDRRFPS